MQLWLWLPVSLLSVSLLHARVDAAVATQLLEQNPDHPNKCYFKETGEIRAVGEEWHSNTTCVRYTCSDGPDNKFLVETAGCGIIVAEPPCNVTSGLPSAVYPACCPTTNCPKR